MTKILIVNLHSSRNAGDDVLTRVTVNQLQQSFAPAELVLAMNDPASYRGEGQTVGSFMTWCRDAQGRWRLVSGGFWLLVSLLILVGYRLGWRSVLRLAPAEKRPLLQAYFTADLVISSAGNFLYSSGYIGLPFIIAIYTIAYAYFARKPIYAMPQTIGPLRRRWEKWLVAWIINQMRIAFVRDDISFAQLAQLSIAPERYRLVPDVAFALTPAPASEGIALLAQAKQAEFSSPHIGVTLVDWGAQNHLFKRQTAYETAVAGALRHFLTRHGGQLFLFAQVRGPSTAENDLNPARRVQWQLADLGERVVVVAAETNPETLKAAYGQMDFFVGTRLHSNIFALSEGIPVIAIQYQPKTAGVMQMLGLADWVIDISEVETESLLALLQKMWRHIGQNQAVVKRVMPPIVTQANQVGSFIAADFGALS
jgi:colanic acid/amylovoran biosynthesis protein